MKSPDKSNLIIDEANGIVENFIKKKTGVNKNGKRIALLSILTICTVLIFVLLIKFI